ncbi:flavin reductase family protein [Tepidamorphus sp. 3E244]|uniref:flavin reductase family protein n=1 Tax=Tepidamorphus sp. 3E244 TaxID=3385498 RepID=UPI0038FCE2B0
MTAETDTGFDPRAFRNCLGQFPTGVCIITAPGEEEPVGMTMSSFNSLSLDPPLVLFSVDKRARGLPQWQQAEAYVIHVLSEGQRELSNRFAKPGENKWEGVTYQRGPAGAPILSGAVAVFHCSPDTQHEAGDHVLFIARVDHFTMNADRRPLVFCGGRYSELGSGHGDADIWPLNIHY